MARPRKRADWYQHPNTMKENPCIRALRKRFGNNGYAVLNYLMEDITRTDELALDFSAKKRLLYAAEYDVTQKELEEIVEFCIELELLSYPSPDQSKLCSPYLEEELLKLLMEKREKDRIRKQKKNNGEYSTENNEYSTENNEYSVENNEYSTENKTDDIPRKTICIPPKTDDIPRKSTYIPRKSTYSKVKESKVKESKEDIDSNESLSSEIQLIKSDKEWLFSMQNKFGLGTEEIYSWLADFATDCACRGKQHHHDIADLKQHFVFWLTKQQIKTKQEPKQPPTKQQWIKCKKELCESSSKEAEMCFRELEFGSFEPYNNNTLTLSVPSPGIDEKIEKNHFEIFTKTIKKYFGENIRLQYYTR